MCSVTVTVDFFTVIFLIFLDTFFTVILHTVFLFPAFAVIVTFPAFLAFTTPFADTVAIFLLLVVNLPLQIS